MFIEDEKLEKHLKCIRHGDMGINPQFIETSKALGFMLEYCPICGTKLKLIEVKIDNGFRCSECKYPVNKDWAYCGFCGVSRSQD
jgi:hypothetical protein